MPAAEIWRGLARAKSAFSVDLTEGLPPRDAAGGIALAQLIGPPPPFWHAPCVNHNTLIYNVLYIRRTINNPVRSRRGSSWIPPVLFNAPGVFLHRGKNGEDVTFREL